MSNELKHPGAMSNHDNIPGSLRRRDIQRRFDRAASGFSNADFVHRTTFDGILERLAPVAAQPDLVLDLGSANGRGSQLLAKHFKKARVLSCDLSAKMLLKGKQNRSFLSRVRELQCDAMQIPLQSGSVDLVIANQLLPWIYDLPACFTEIGRVLRKDGAFVFSTLGPDSLDELRQAWGAIDDDWHVNVCPDMHNLGDAAVQAGLKDPVLDVDSLSVTYSDTAALYRDLTGCGARNSLRNRRRTLTGKGRFRRMEQNLLREAEEGPLTLRLELVYGHAFGGGPPQKSGEYRVDPAAIGRRQR